jgi:hypothetical protein
MDIYTSAAGFLFVNSFSNFASLFFKMWIKDNNKRGVRNLRADTYFRSHFEILSKSVMVATILSVWYNCLYKWFQEPDRVIFENVEATYMNVDRRSTIPAVAISITFSMLPLLYKLTKGKGFIKIDDQGFEIDTEAKKEKILEDQIKGAVKDWFNMKPDKFYEGFSDNAKSDNSLISDFSVSMADRSPKNKDFMGPLGIN